jgi:ankyrin repeat protein
MFIDSEGRTPIFNAVEANNVDLVKLFLESVGPGLLEAEDLHSRTVLHWAAMFSSPNTLSTLLKYARPDLLSKTDSYFKRPVDYCKNEECRREFEKILI